MEKIVPLDLPQNLDDYWLLRIWCSARIGGSKIRPTLITGGSLWSGPLSPSKARFGETSGPVCIN